MNRPPTPNEIEGAARAASNSAAPNSGASESDAELVQAARRGDKRAFIEIVTRYQPMVCAVTLGILNHFAASEDAAQEAFLAAWRKFHELREPERLRSWLGQIARNAALGHLRRLRGHDTLTPVPSLADEAPGPDEAAATEEEATLVRDALAKLPENYRLPLVLFYRDNQSVRAVAEALDISEDAVKQRLARGREMLRDRVAGVIGEVLTRTGPKARFTIAIAAAIGALAAPAAVAGSIFAATTTTTAAVSASASATVTTSSTASPSASLLTAMSTSKGFLAMTALVAVFCIPVGYQLSTAKTSLASGSTAAAVLTSGQTNLEARIPSFEDSAFFAAWRELHEKHGTNAQAMPALYKAIAGLSEPFRRRAFRSALIAEWVQVEPTNGLAFFLGKGVDEAQRRQFFEEWLARDARVAVDALLASPSGWEEMARDCLPEIARRLPARLAEIASRLPAPESYYDTNVRDAFGILAADNLVSARQAAERVTGPSREQALGGVAQVWAKNELEGAVAWAKGLGTERDEVIRHALLGKASVDPVAALELAGIVPSGGRHAHGESTTGARVLGEAAKTDFDATVNWLIAHPGRFGHEDLMGLSQAVTTRLNAGVAAFLNGRVKDGSLAALMPALESALLNNASGQGAAVWEWLKTQDATEATTSLKRNVLNFAGYQDPELALRLATELPRTPQGDAQTQELARCLLNGGNMLNRFERLYEQAAERLRQPLVEAAFHFLGGTELTEPQLWLTRLALLPEASRTQGIESIARAWTQQNPEEAIGWTTSLPAGETRERAVAAVASAWAAKDPHNAGAWVEAMPAGGERERSAVSLASALAERYPQDAWNWALSVNDPAERLRAATQAAKGIASRDAALARKWIDTAPLAPEVKAELQAVVGQARLSPGRR